MKKIYSFIVTVFALLVIAPNLNAQYTIRDVIGDLSFPNEGDFSQSNGVGFRKDISSPVDGKYWLRLEAYANGSAISTTSSVPSDVVLVLDLSSSMRDENNLYNGQLRIDALKDATSSFVEIIYQNAVDALAQDPTYKGNRIAIVTYAGESYITNATGWVTVNETGKNSLQTTISNLNTYSGTRPELGLKKVIDELLSGSTEATSARSDAHLSVVLFTDGYPVEDQATPGEGSGNTRFEYPHANDAIHYAHVVKETYGATLFTVGLITTVNQDNSVEYRNYRRVLYLMSLLSSNYPDANIDLGLESAWTVAGNSTGAITVQGLTTGDPIEGVDPGATNATDTPYFKLVTPDMNLSAIFEEFASQSGGSAATSLTEESQAVDVVSSSFVLPEGTTASDIKVFTAPYRYDADNEEFYFDTETLAPYSTDTYDDYTVGTDGLKTLVAEDVDVDGTADDPTIEVTLSSDGKTVSVTGFDYSDNWCGPIKNTSDQVTGAQGHKVIIMIPIMMNPDAVGGPDIETNGANSGIKDKDGNLLVQFTSPEVSLPINIHINAQGLEVGESAKYTLRRRTGSSGSWEYVTTVFVTRHEGQGENDAIVYIKGLPSNSSTGEYVYKVEQEDWGWSYECNTVTGIGPGGTTVTITDLDAVTSDKFEINPISFVLEKDAANKVSANSYAESKATNTFGAGAGVGYDDSKSNGRTVIVIESSTTEPTEP